MNNAFRQDMIDLCEEYEGEDQRDFYIAAAQLVNRYIREDDNATALDRHLAATIATRAIQVRMQNEFL